jgi:hypothetical protein
MDREIAMGAVAEADLSGLPADRTNEAAGGLPQRNRIDWIGLNGPRLRPWRDGALIVASWAVLVAFVFVPAFQILGLVLIPVLATLLVRGGDSA